MVGAHDDLVITRYSSSPAANGYVLIGTVMARSSVCPAVVDNEVAKVVVDPPASANPLRQMHHAAAVGFHVVERGLNPRLVVRRIPVGANQHRGDGERRLRSEHR